MWENIREIERHFAAVGIPVAVLYALILVGWQARKRNAAFAAKLDRFSATMGLKPSPLVKKIILVTVSLLAVVAYTYCYYCGKSIGQKASHEGGFFHVLVSFTIRVFPYFIAGCLLSGIIEKAVRLSSRWLPRSMLGAGLFASLLPICSCAAVPFSYSLMATKRIRLRGVITFMMIVPVINPFVIVFAQGVLGWWYVIWRIVSIFILAMLTGTLIEHFLGVREPDHPGYGCYACKGCNTSGGAAMHATNSALEASYNLMLFLIPYIVIGIAIGAAFTVFIPPYVVGKYLSARFSGMLMAVLIGLPIFLCSGEDILILAPLMQMGLPMGHAIALTITGNGICLSSIALLFPLFGKKASLWIIAAFGIGSILIGLAINQLGLLFPGLW